MALGFGQYVQKSSSTPRIKELLRRVQKEGATDPEDIMLIIMDVLKEDALYPEVGKFYTFVYNPKTYGIEYDQHPLIACTDIQRWGFRGENFHWGKSRNYTWAEVAGKLYSVKYNELDELLSLQYGKFRINK